MDQLMELAQRLGRQIAAHERTTLLQKAQQAIDDDPPTKELLGQYQQQAQKIQELEQQQKPIEVDDKHKLQGLEEKLSTNPQIAELARRQADFVEMMHKVKQAIDDQIGNSP